MNIGVLALQGAFIEHVHALNRLGVTASEVRLPHQLENLDGLIIPGGESTTIGKLAVEWGLMEPLRDFGKSNAIWGTCAGAIFLSKDARRDQPLLGLMDITVQRNAFGRQAESFETELDVAALSKNGNGHVKPFHAIFIRAPLIEEVGPGVEVIARVAKGGDAKNAPVIVAARQGRLLATSFHPELTRDDRFHQLFVDMAGR
jgi:pyridoxal 5'-phosphate synthase pdxT subunit